MKASLHLAFGMHLRHLTILELLRLRLCRLALVLALPHLRCPPLASQCRHRQRVAACDEEQVAQHQRQTRNAHGSRREQAQRLRWLVETTTRKARDVQLRREVWACRPAKRIEGGMLQGSRFCGNNGRLEGQLLHQHLCATEDVVRWRHLQRLRSFARRERLLGGDRHERAQPLLRTILVICILRRKLRGLIARHRYFRHFAREVHRCLHTPRTRSRKMHAGLRHILRNLPQARLVKTLGVPSSRTFADVRIHSNSSGGTLHDNRPVAVHGYHCIIWSAGDEEFGDEEAQCRPHGYETCTR
mmetsp:Transcript_115606/g.331955  ORF Transcript_115606/g.331955 Transcript_115606/m.331955 type:complete len:301 (-) Transcript_115606:161-1063(-)